MITKRIVLQLGLLTLASLLIWFIGPLISIANHSFLQAPIQRCYIIAMVFLLWSLIHLFWHDLVTKKTVAHAPPSPSILKKLHLLQKRFQGAVLFLKKTIINKHGIKVPLAELPWQLVIGPSGAGKTTLLAHCGINFILAKQFKLEDLSKIPPSETCDWWVTRDQVLIDIPGTYCIGKIQSSDKNEIDQGMVANSLWQHLLHLICGSKQKKRLNSVIIAMHLPELMAKQPNETALSLIRDLRNRILDLIHAFGANLPFYLVITKCDLLPGFTEFFADSGSDELTQAWGITLPPHDPKEKLSDLFIHRFNALIKRLNKQVIWRLHQERNPNARPFIKDFPLQIERLKDNIHSVLKTLMIPQLSLQGVYLTSAIQPRAEDNALYASSLANAFSQHALQLMRPPTTPTQTYFIRQLVMQGLLNTSETHATPKLHLITPRWALYTASIGLIATTAFLLGHDFEKSIRKTYAIQNELAHYQLSSQQSHASNDRFIKVLPLLEALHQTSASANQRSALLANVLTFYSNKSQQTARLVYQQALQTILVPGVKTFFETYLRSANEKNPDSVYSALKAYLMLSHPNQLDARMIANTLSHLLSSPIHKQTTMELANHIEMAFTHSPQEIVLDSHLIANVRKQLTNLPPLESAMVILKNMADNNEDSTIGLGTNLGTPPVFVSQEIANNILTMFTATHFQPIVTQEIAIAASEALKGNGILGEVSPGVNQPAIEALSNALRTRYIANYVDLWESLIANIHLYTPKDLAQTDHMIMNLTGNHSPLLELLRTIKENTAFAPINTESPKIRALTNWLDQANRRDQNPLYQMFVSSQQLHRYLQTVLTASDSNQAAFNLIMRRLQQSDINNNPIAQIHELADQNPEPMKTWFHGIANQSWGFILQKAALHIDHAWQQSIVTAYNLQLANHYPFDQTATVDVNLQQFIQFLGAHGKLSSFVQTYLKPLINEKDQTWTWQVIDHQKIPFSDVALSKLQHAFQLQRAFFPNGDNTLFVPFTLHPVSLEPDMKSFTLNINGQQVTYQKGEARSSRLLTWPGTNTLHETTLHFITPNNQLIGDTIEGNWAWFRLVNKATESINTRKELLLNFRINGHSATYLLYTEGHTNPFLPLNLSRFEIPQELI